MAPVTVRSFQSVGHTVLELSAPSTAGAPVAPRDVCLVVDTSGSMSCAANIKAEGVAAQYSKLDVVKHALRTVMESLSENDRVAVVEFESSVRLAAGLRAADVHGKEDAVQSVTALTASGATSLWDGLKLGLDTLANDRREGALPVVMLLTDGLPNPACPRGEAHELREYMQAAAESGTKDLTAVHTFGIGYDLNSELLEELALTTPGGTYNFIPDGGMVGTVIINALSNAAATAHTNVRLVIEGATAADVKGNLPAVSLPGAVPAVEVSVGDIRGGQPRHVVVKGSPTAARAVLVDGGVVAADAPGEEDFELVDSARDMQGAVESVHEADAVVARELARVTFVTEVADATKKGKLLLEQCQSRLASIAELLQGEPVLDDLLGQVAEAFAEKAAFMKWGRHFLPSLVGAHRDERCNNFKDPGVQSYAGPDFLAWRDKLDALFNSLQPPAPSLARPGFNATAVGTPVNFAASFNDYRNGCFAPGTSVRLAGGGLAPVESLRKGDAVATPDGPREVLCLTRHVSGDGRSLLVALPGSGLRLTPWHPVRLEAGGRWSFPAWHADAQEVECGEVWNLVLAGGSAVYADGVVACTLGHGLMDDVVRHAYYGTGAVVRDLQRLPGFGEGLVTVQPGDVQRRHGTRVVCGIGAAEAAPAPAAGSLRASDPVNHSRK